MDNATSPLAAAIANFIRALSETKVLGVEDAYQLTGAAYHLAEVSGCRPDVVFALRREDSEPE